MGDHVAQEAAEHPRRLGHALARLRYVDRVLAEVGKHEVAEKLATVRVRVGAHPSPAGRRERPKLGDEAAALVEQLLRPIAVEPLLELPEMLRVLAHLRERHLMGAPRPLHRLPVDCLRAGPPLGRPQDEHRPRGALDSIVGLRSFSDLADPVERLVEHDGQSPMHLRGIVPVTTSGAQP